MEGSIISINCNKSTGIAVPGVKPNSISSLPSPRCATCALNEACVSDEGNHDAPASRLRIKRGETLYRAGGHFHGLYIIHTGFFKTFSLTEDGRDQVTGFHMAGEVVGMDGIQDETHSLTAVALEDSQVCAVPFSAVEAGCSRVPQFQQTIFKLLSREIVRGQELTVLIGSMRAEERVAAFLLDLSQRLAARGYSGTEFHLRMTREEIGSYLGLKLETVSRTFSRFQDMGMFEVHNKHISGLDVVKLTTILEDASAQRMAQAA